MKLPVGKDENDNVEVSLGTHVGFVTKSRDHVTLECTPASTLPPRLKADRLPFCGDERTDCAYASRIVMLDLRAEQHGYSETRAYLVNTTRCMAPVSCRKFASDLISIPSAGRRSGPTRQHSALIPTAEVPLTNLVMKSSANQLPIKMTARRLVLLPKRVSYGHYDTRGYSYASV